MKILVLGANGKTGGLVMKRAVALGHEVSVLVRHAGSSTPVGVRVVVGDALNAESVLGAVSQQDVVIDCIGGTKPWKTQTLERDAVRNVVAGMKTSGTRLLLVVSALGAGDSAKQAPWWFRYLMVPTLLRGSTADKTAMESIVRNSGVDFVIAQPPILTDGAATGTIRVLEKGEQAHEITRADLAVWLVAQIERREYVGKTVVVANR